jgi:23S rRNA pseudouridine1911/1915/1917 synthase
VLQPLVIRHLDDQLVVAEKPSGMNTVRHPAEREWKDERRQLDPTLEDVAQWAISERLKRPARELPRLRVVHRLDKDTSGLVVFARTADAERWLGKQFHAHTVLRRYQAVVFGHFPTQTIRSYLVRDRGDARRGSTPNASLGKEAITHVTLVERIGDYSLLTCKLETGRTHQIRIHLSEMGHPVCGEKVYNRKPSGEPLIDPSDAPRLCLHALELGFVHPAGENLHWQMDPPFDLQGFQQSLRRAAAKRITLPKKS